jgi:hypothetical protein
MEVLGDLGAFGFWMFVAAVVVAGIWYDARKTESEQETLRRLVESGNDIDSALLEKMLAAGKKSSRTGQELKTSGVIVIFVAPGLAILGWFMQAFNDKMWHLMLGVSLMVGIIGVGLYVAGKMAEPKGTENRY